MMSDSDQNKDDGERERTAESVRIPLATPLSACLSVVFVVSVIIVCIFEKLSKDRL